LRGWKSWGGKEKRGMRERAGGVARRYRRAAKKGGGVVKKGEVREEGRR